ncbi:MAG: hypothetical protein AMXMBFR56_79970 [Polyangiaceae bacterium]
MGGDIELGAGDRLGDYEIVRELGHGGFGRVFEVVHTALGKRAAAKVLNPERAARPDVLRRFLREAQAGAKLAHPGIVEVFDYGQLDDGRPYFVMELLTGKSLAALLDERGHLELEDALPILGSVAEALDAAHAGGIAHRDLKPANVFLDERSGIKLLDFGVAKLLGDDDSITTDETAIIGTPHYMSPEQSRGRPIDTRADLYALGVLCFRVLTGRLPFDADDPVGILVQHAAHPSPTPSSVRPGLTPEVDRAVLAMLEKDPAKRPSSATTAVRALSMAPAGRRGTWRWVALAAVVVGTGVAVLSGRRPPAAAQGAEQPAVATAAALPAPSEPAEPPTPPPSGSAPTRSKPSVHRTQRAPDPEAIEDPFQR